MDNKTYLLLDAVHDSLEDAYIWMERFLRGEDFSNYPELKEISSETFFLIRIASRFADILRHEHAIEENKLSNHPL